MTIIFNTNTNIAAFNSPDHYFLVPGPIKITDIESCFEYHPPFWAVVIFANKKKETMWDGFQSSKTYIIFACV